MKKVLEKGSIIATTVIGNCVYSTFNDVTVKVGKINKKNWSWLGLEEVKDGDIDLVVLDYTSKGYIIFSRKHLTCKQEAIAKLSEDELIEFINNLPNNR